MAVISIDDLRARHARLSDERRINRDLLLQLEQQQRACVDRESGFKFVLGELEAMMGELEAREKDERNAQIERELQSLGEGENNAG